MASLGGLAPTLSALATFMTSAKAELDQRAEEAAREMGMTCTLNVLGLVKCT